MKTDLLILDGDINDFKYNEDYFEKSEEFIQNKYPQQENMEIFQKHSVRLDYYGIEPYKLLILKNKENVKTAKLKDIDIESIMNFSTICCKKGWFEKTAPFKEDDNKKWRNFFLKEIQSLDPETIISVTRVHM